MIKESVAYHTVEYYQAVNKNDYKAMQLHGTVHIRKLMNKEEYNFYYNKQADISIEK